MKKLFLLLLLTLNVQANVLSPKNFTIQASGAGESIQVTQTGVNARMFKLQSHINNVGNVCIGDSTVNATGFLCTSESGAIIDFPQLDGQLYSLSDVYIHFVNAGDTGVILYW